MGTESALSPLWKNTHKKELEGGNYFISAYNHDYTLKSVLPGSVCVSAPPFTHTQPFVVKAQIINLRGTIVA